MSADPIRLVQSPTDPAVDAFAHLQEEVYYDSSTLIPGVYFQRMLASRSPSRRNFLIVAEREERVVGGTLFHHLAKVGTGFSSFMGIHADARGQGLARRLHEARFRTLDEANGEPVFGIFIDVVAPERLPQAELEAERRFGFEPTLRRRVFQALGFRKVNIEYRQPVGGPHGGPLTTLDLLFCPRAATTTAISAHLVAETMRDYWGSWLGEERTQREVERLRSLGTGSMVELVDAFVTP